MDTRHYARLFAEAGVRVFPVWGIKQDSSGIWRDLQTGAVANREDGSGKQPMGPWKEMATTDLEKIDAWFREAPDMNYGVVLGEARTRSDASAVEPLVVVDCDSEDATDRFEEAWANIQGELEIDTFTVKTSRGVHYYFAGNSRTFKLAPETDLKAAGGYVVGPGSRTWTGSTYEPVSGQIGAFKAAPSWIVQSERSKPETSGEPIRLIKGDRNNTLFLLASHFLGLGLDHDKVEDLVRDINETRSDSPLDDYELESTIFTTMRKYPVGTRIHDLVDLNSLEAIAAKWSGSEPVASRFFEMREDLEMWPPPKWLIEGWLPTTGLWQLYAPSYAGKTYLALDLALSLSNGKKWFDREIEHATVVDELTGARVRKDWVLYVLAEGSFDFRQRVESWCARNGGSFDRLIVVRQKTLDLASSKGWDRIVEEFEKDTRAAAIKDRIGLVVLDTQSMLLDTDENSNRAMSAAAGVLGQASAFMQAPVLLVHHTGKGDAQASRGASSMVAAMDVVMRLTNEDRGVKLLRFDKVKGARLPTDLLRFMIDDEGESAVVSPLGADDVEVLVAQSNGYLDAIRAILGSVGENQDERVTGIPYSTLRQQLGILKGTADDLSLRAALPLLTEFVIGPERINRSLVVRLASWS